MQNWTIRDGFPARLLGLAGLLAAFAMAGDADAGAVCPSFPVAASVALIRAPDAVAVADLDGDHVPDLVANALGSGVSVLLGNGDGSFQPAVFLAAGGYLDAIAVADLDGDGVADLVTADDNSDEVNVLLGNGDGSFQAAVSFPTGDRPRSLAVADFDGDGALDLVTGNIGAYPNSYRDVSVLLGTGDGSFQAAVSSPVPVPRLVSRSRI